MRNFLLFLGLGLVPFLVGCGPRTFEDVESFAAYVRGPESPDRETITRDGVVFHLQHLTAEAMLIPQYRRYEQLRQRLSGDPNMADSVRVAKLAAVQADIARARQGYEGSLYFLLTLGYEGEGRDLVYDRLRQEGFGAYSAWLQRLLFSMNEYVYLETPTQQEVPLSLYHMERSYGTTQDRTFLLIFPQTFNEVRLTEADWWKFHIEEFGLGTGAIAFDIDPPDDHHPRYLMQ